MSSLPYELALALRYLRPKRTFVSIITLICILGVALGVAVLIIVISVMTGFGIQLRERLTGFSAHLRVERAGPGAIADWRPLMDRIATNAGVRGVAPYVNAQVLVETQPDPGRGSHVFGVIARGVDPKLEGRVSDLTNNLIQGEFRLTPKSVLVPVGLASDHQIRVGDRLEVYSVPTFRQMREAQRRNEGDVFTGGAEYWVRGILDLGMDDLNNSVMITSLVDGADLWGEGDGGGAQGLTVMLNSPDERTTERMTRHLRQVLGPDYFVGNWLTKNRPFLDALATEKAMMFYILFFIVIVAAFGNMSALITFVVQKTREIGVLKALGARPASVAMLFLGQSAVVGVLGVASGFVLGMLALHYRNEFLHFMNHRLGFDLFPASIYQFSGLPARIVPGDVAVICGGSLVICLLAGVLPALRAAWLQPVQALRNE
ncbi:MAG: ABC transporter permease [Verrucomicrobia bacterium]|nr:ABC transporter permease [Verrucomicrobiota bacterium]